MSRLGSKGQSLAIFVILIPVFIMLGALVVDGTYAKYQSRKLDNLAKEVIRYGLKNISGEPYDNMVDLIYQNDSNIDSYKINILNDEKVFVEIKKATRGFFGSVVGKDIYKVKSSYVGYFINDKMIIEKKAK